MRKAGTLEERPRLSIFGDLINFQVRSIHQQQYITKAYDAPTTFNLFFMCKDDQSRGKSTSNA